MLKYLLVANGLMTAACGDGLLSGPTSSCARLAAACEDMAVAMCVDHEICDSVTCTATEQESWCDVVDSEEITLQQCRDIATWVSNHPCEDP